MSGTDRDPLIEQTREFNAALEGLLATVPAVHQVPPAESRRLRRAGKGVYPAPTFLSSARIHAIEGPGGPLPLRIFDPPGSTQGAFLHIHGGGWTLGESDMQDPRLDRLARETGLTVVSVGYRLAPEHPYPAAPDDCEAAALWLAGPQAGDHIATTDVLGIGGDSAGAHLAAVTLQRLRDRYGGAHAFGAAVLQYGDFDLSMTPSQRRWGERNLVLSTPIIEWFADQFLPEHRGEQRRDPDISPLFGDLAGMPPAIFTCGTLDPLLDDTLFMEARWRTAGAPTELRLYPEAPHGFLSLPMTVTDVALAAEHDFLRRALGLSG